MNGEMATREQLLWAEGEPNNMGDEDCLLINTQPRDNPRSNDFPCTSSFVGLCEKRI